VEAELSPRLRETVGFDWDAGNVDKTWTKHAVRFTECEEVFYRAPLVALAPARRGPGEERFVARGETALGRLLSIIFTFRGDRVRVISARDMSREERLEYSQREEA
jgi:uncharacterized DUF497 family protein